MRPKEESDAKYDQTATPHLDSMPWSKMNWVNFDGWVSREVLGHFLKSGVVHDKIFKKKIFIFEINKPDIIISMQQSSQY